MFNDSDMLMEAEPAMMPAMASANETMMSTMDVMMGK